MGTVERSADLAGRRISRILTQMGDEIRNAWLARGLSQEAIGKPASIRQATVSYIERGARPNATVRELAHLMSAVGLELSLRAFASGTRVRDAAHRALLERLRARTHPDLKWRFEVPIPISDDDRAWDATLDCRGRWLAIEAETRIRDVQALQRKIALKRRDDPRVLQVVILVADTGANRAALKAEAAALLAEYPLSARALLAQLGEGRLPDSGGVVLL